MSRPLPIQCCILQLNDNGNRQSSIADCKDKSSAIRKAAGASRNSSKLELSQLTKWLVKQAEIIGIFNDLINQLKIFS